MKRIIPEAASMGSPHRSETDRVAKFHAHPPVTPNGMPLNRAPAREARWEPNSGTRCSALRLNGWFGGRWPGTTDLDRGLRSPRQRFTR